MVLYIDYFEKNIFCHPVKIPYKMHCQYEHDTQYNDINNVSYTRINNENSA
jgi:hypothetical protein